LPPDKAADFQKNAVIYSAIATAVALHPTPPGYDPRSLSTPSVPGTPRLHEVSERPLAGGRLFEDARPNAECRTLVEVNSWSGRIAGVDTYICAGRMPGKAAQGGMLTVRIKVDNAPDPEWPYVIASYYPPAPFGSIKIVDIVGTQIVLQAETGAHLIFDLSTGQWIDPSGTPLPTFTP
jgi:hypothetical protein